MQDDERKRIHNDTRHLLYVLMDTALPLAYGDADERDDATLRWLHGRVARLANDAQQRTQSRLTERRAQEGA